MLGICRGAAGGRKEVEPVRDPTWQVGVGLQRRRSWVTHTSAWQHFCLKIEREETEIKGG